MPPKQARNGAYCKGLLLIGLFCEQRDARTRVLPRVFLVAFCASVARLVQPLRPHSEVARIVAVHAVTSYRSFYCNCTRVERCRAGLTNPRHVCVKASSVELIELR